METKPPELEGAATDEREVAVAQQIDLPDGRRIWVPPTGRPFWCHTQPTRDLTDAEVAEHLSSDRP